jgi:hypothetical protein
MDGEQTAVLAAYARALIEWETNLMNGRPAGDPREILKDATAEELRALLPIFPSEGIAHQPVKFELLLREGNILAWSMSWSYTQDGKLDLRWSVTPKAYAEHITATIDFENPPGDPKL